MVLAAVKNNESVRLDLLGGMNGVMADSGTLVVSRWFGDVVGAVTAVWSGTDASIKDAYWFIGEGLRKNSHIDAMVHALDVLAAVPPPDLRHVVLALDQRVHDSASHPLLRVEAAAGMMRFAIADGRWRSLATASLQVLEELDHPFAAPRLCRLAAVGWEHFRDDDLLGMLERKASLPDSAVQARYERGMLGISIALERNGLPEIAAGLGEAHRWLRQACEADEDADRGQVYLLLIEALLSILNAEPTRAGLAEELRSEARTRYLYGIPRHGAEWLTPPRGAELEWVPLVDRIARVSAKLGRASWLDAAAVLTDVLRLYSAERAIQPGLPGVEKAIRPAIEAAFVRERGLVAHLDEWLEGPGREALGIDDARRLRENIAATIERGPTGNPMGTSSPGKTASPKNWPPV